MSGLRWLISVLLLALSAAPLAAAESEHGKMEGVGDFEIPEWFKVSFLNLPEDVKEAGQADKNLLLVWYQDGCPYCERLINTNFSQKGIVEYTQEHFDVIALNLWGSRTVTGLDGGSLSEKALGKRMGVQFTPTLQFLDKQGEVVLRLNGYYPPEKFRTALQYVGEDAFRNQAFSAFMKANTPEGGKPGKLLAEPFFADSPHDLSEKKGPVAVFFEQRQCPDCVRLHEGILDDPRMRELLEPFHVVQVDRWSEDKLVTPGGKRLSARQWGDELGLDYVPAMVLFDRGEEVIRMESLFKGFHVRSMVDYVASGAYRDQPRFQRYIQARSERLMEEGQTVDLWEKN
ncbi:thioredoxin family protein [Thiohalorhabdus sp. Cl-TMA]|uniref:Thioredoxin family protein n=1 Tax=Thiohalorhabdus methylotrophus TaxID=3242694 RepID=A0ABV4TYL2_9GAMM